MGLFGFGKKKRDAAANHDAQAAEENMIAAETANETANDAVVSADSENSETIEIVEQAAADALQQTSNAYEGRGESRGPWDVDDEDVPDYDEYLDLGAYYLPFLQQIELRIKANRSTGAVLGATVTYKKSSLEIEAYAAPKTLGLWEDIREDLLESNAKAKAVNGVFGTEVSLPVAVKGGKSVTTRIVGVDGPRWMLRGIFSGTAATDPHSQETQTLNRFFADIVVERGEEPLAPRDLIAMHEPVTPAERKAAMDDDSEIVESEEEAMGVPARPDSPLSKDQQTQVKTTLSRGPMFSEVR